MRIKAVLGPSLKIMDPSSEKSKNRSNAAKSIAEVMLGKTSGDAIPA